ILNNFKFFNFIIGSLPVSAQNILVALLFFDFKFSFQLKKFVLTSGTNLQIEIIKKIRTHILHEK
ncbi:TPA: hypothetical protein ACGBK0_004676, partial [Escherichia coli]